MNASAIVYANSNTMLQWFVAVAIAQYRSRYVAAMRTTINAVRCKQTVSLKTFLCKHQEENSRKNTFRTESPRGITKSGPGGSKIVAVWSSLHYVEKRPRSVRPRPFRPAAPPQPRQPCPRQSALQFWRLVSKRTPSSPSRISNFTKKFQMAAATMRRWRLARSSPLNKKFFK